MIDPEEERRTLFLWPPEDCKVYLEACPAARNHWSDVPMGRFLRCCFTEITLLCRSFGDVSFWYFWIILSTRGYFAQMCLPSFYQWQCQVWMGVESSRVNPLHPQTNHWGDMVQTCFSVVLPCYCGMHWVAWIESFNDLLACKTWSSDERILFGISCCIKLAESRSLWHVRAM